MPTNVRNLYTELREQGEDGSNEARALSRDFDQAVSEFVPGAVRTWDKRALLPIGLAGTCRRSWNHWKSEGEPLSAAYLHLHCSECRQMIEVPASTSDFRAESSPSWWQDDYVRATTTPTVFCPSCGLLSARPYLAVAPAGFITDLRTDRPAGGFEPGRKQRAPTAHVVAPALGEGVSWRNIETGAIGLSRQGRVYRTNRNKGELFGFRSENSMLARNENFGQVSEVRLQGRLWLGTEGAPDIKVAIVSPKTTDLLAIRGLDGEGLVFFDEAGGHAARRAAWYSAATLLQRAIALELDVDSLDIEIASVHRTTSPWGAELYLADAHPNGAGLVAWAADNWRELVDGSIAASGPLQQFGRLALEEIGRSVSEPWRSPDLLLRGFRNRALHPLIDFALGAELLQVLSDESYVPGLDPARLRHDAPSYTALDWPRQANDLAKIYVKSFEGMAVELPSLGGISGWREVDEATTAVAVVHPLWSSVPGRRNGVRAVHQWARSHGCEHVRLVDSFNLSRRLAWVRGMRNKFSYLPVDSTPEPMPLRRPGVHVDGSADDLFAIEALPIGARFDWGSRSFTRVAPGGLRDAPAGDWLVVSEDASPFVAQVRLMPGAAARRRRLGNGRLTEQDLDARLVGLAAALAAVPERGI